MNVEDLKLILPSKEETTAGCAGRRIIIPSLATNGEMKFGEFGYGIYFNNGDLWFRRKFEPLTGDWIAVENGGMSITQTGNYWRGIPFNFWWNPDHTWGPFNQNGLVLLPNPGITGKFYPDKQILDTYWVGFGDDQHLFVRQGHQFPSGWFTQDRWFLNVIAHGDNCVASALQTELVDIWGGIGTAACHYDHLSGKFTFEVGDYKGFVNPDDMMIIFENEVWWYPITQGREPMTGYYWERDDLPAPIRLEGDHHIVRFEDLSGSLGWGPSEGLIGSGGVIEAWNMPVFATWNPGSREIVTFSGAIWKLEQYDLDGEWTHEHYLARIYHGFRFMTIIAPHSQIGTAFAILKFEQLIIAELTGTYDKVQDTITWSNGEVWERAR